MVYTSISRNLTQNWPPQNSSNSPKSLIFPFQCCTFAVVTIWWVFVAPKEASGSALSFRDLAFSILCQGQARARCTQNVPVHTTFVRYGEDAPSLLVGSFTKWEEMIGLPTGLYVWKSPHPPQYIYTFSLSLSLSLIIMQIIKRSKELRKCSKFCPHILLSTVRTHTYIW